MARRMLENLRREERVRYAERRETGARRTGRLWMVALGLAMAALLAGCGAPSYPGGVYQSAQYHFSVRYPSGWQANASPQPDATAPLIVVITRSGNRAANVSLISSLTINVLDTSAPGVAQSIAGLAKNPALKQTTLGGHVAYTDSAQQSGTSLQGAVQVTHTDYYLVAGSYEYTISADALPGDEATIQQMEQSFTLLS